MAFLHSVKEVWHLLLILLFCIVFVCSYLFVFLFYHSSRLEMLKKKLITSLSHNVSIDFEFSLSLFFLCAFFVIIFLCSKL